MDPGGKIYLADALKIIDEDKARLHEQIRAWYAKLKAGGSLWMGDNEHENSLILATVRALNGLGPDRTDPNGEQAMAEVRAALDQGQPAPGRR